MSRKSYESYGERARTMLDPMQATGRLIMTRLGEKLILADVVKKLEIGPGDSLLDIGCGIGNIGIPLSFLVREYVGVDHPDVVARFKRRLPEDCPMLIGGNFLDSKPERTFDRVLAYAMIHYLTDYDEVLRFVDLALGVLPHGGRLLIGDIPNPNLKARFMTSPLAQEKGKEWDQTFENNLPKEREAVKVLTIAAEQDTEVVKFNDAVILALVAHIRSRGFDAWVEPQTFGLPFCTQREDIVVSRP